MMPWNNKGLQPKLATIAFMVLFISATLLSGCAVKQWTDPLQENEYDSAVQLLDVMTTRDAACGKTMVADLELYYSSPFEKRALDGFFQFSFPSSYKYIVTNPFGQTLWGVAGDQKNYQSLNTSQNQYTAGGLDSFALRYNLPLFLLHGNWANWLTARNEYNSESITAIRNDREARGIWITLQTNKVEKYSNHLLIDRELRRILMRIVSDKNEQHLATIEYDRYIQTGNCQQPLEITINGLDYGVSIRLELDNVELIDEATKYSLPYPKNYLKRFLP